MALVAAFFLKEVPLRASAKPPGDNGKPASDSDKAASDRADTELEAAATPTG